MHRQENANLAARKLGQKDLTRPRCEEDSSGAGKPGAVSSVMENMRFSEHRYNMEKICQSIQKKLGRTSINAKFSVKSYKNRCIGMENVHGIVDESRHSPRARFLFKKFGNLQEHIIREHRECVQHQSKKVIKEHSEEILNVRSLDY